MALVFLGLSIFYAYHAMPGTSAIWSILAVGNAINTGWYWAKLIYTRGFHRSNADHPANPGFMRPKAGQIIQKLEPSYTKE